LPSRAKVSEHVCAFPLNLSLFLPLHRRSCPKRLLRLIGNAPRPVLGDRRASRDEERKEKQERRTVRLPCHDRRSPRQEEPDGEGSRSSPLSKLLLIVPPPYSPAYVFVVALFSWLARRACCVGCCFEVEGGERLGGRGGALIILCGSRWRRNKKPCAFLRTGTAAGVLVVCSTLCST